MQYGSLKHNHTDDYIKSKWYDAEMLILDKKINTKLYVTYNKPL